jgi:hypothetical protein
LKKNTHCKKIFILAFVVIIILAQALLHIIQGHVDKKTGAGNQNDSKRDDFHIHPTDHGSLLKRELILQTLSATKKKERPNQKS